MHFTSPFVGISVQSKAAELTSSPELCEICKCVQQYAIDINWKFLPRDAAMLARSWES